MNPAPLYTGRFAPSPTGPVHLGSLVAALASFLDARANGGHWLLRIDDLDPPREAPGAAGVIIEGLQRHGMEWDGPVVYQSQRGAAYEAAIQQLQPGGALFHCTCSRAALREHGGACPGICHHRHTPPAEPHSIRLRIECGLPAVDDRIQGHITARQDDACTDVVLRRRDGLYAYPLAVVVDDAARGVTDVVRGADLLDATPGQIALQHALGLPTPRYAHVPVIVAADGRKLSKQNHAPALDASRAAANLRLALRFLGQAAPEGDSTAAILDAAIRHWRPNLIPPLRAARLPS